MHLCVCFLYKCLKHTHPLPLPQVAVLAHGIHGNETPFTFGSTVPRMTFHWTVTNMDVFSLVSVYEKVHMCAVTCHCNCSLVIGQTESNADSKYCILYMQLYMRIIYTDVLYHSVGKYIRRAGMFLTHGSNLLCHLLSFDK